MILDEVCETTQEDTTVLKLILAIQTVNGKTLIYWILLVSKINSQSLMMLSFMTTG